MLLSTLVESVESATTLLPLSPSGLAAWLARQSPDVRAWVEASRFTAAPHTALRLPDRAAVLLGMDECADHWSFASAPSLLSAGDYCLDNSAAVELASNAALGWALGSYRYDVYKSAAMLRMPRLRWPAGVDRKRVMREVRAISLVRDLVNTPANDMGPAELAAAAWDVARVHEASIRVLVGDELLEAGYPTIHAVGRASSRQPRLVDLRWGDDSAPLVALVGKGVCFDSGGLSIKGSDSMRLMKKDMAGAAHALALAQMIMEAQLPVRLRLLLPIVENAIGGNALRPGDIVRTRGGLSVEVANTDAEGRLILCDALAEAASDNPDVLLDMATLTSAARVALGPDLPALFCNDEDLAAALLRAAASTSDPLWRLPLWRAYAADLEGKTADLNNCLIVTFAGAIYAALFLQAFVPAHVRWAHIDLYGWNQKDRPGRPEGGEAQTLRAAFQFLETRYVR